MICRSDVFKLERTSIGRKGCKIIESRRRPFRRLTNMGPNSVSIVSTSTDLQSTGPLNEDQPLILIQIQKLKALTHFIKGMDGQLQGLVNMIRLYRDTLIKIG